MTESDKKPVMDERRYAIITKESITMMAEAAGHDDIDDSVAGILGEDVSYRLREITQKSAQFMRHGRRKRMNTCDFNKACKYSDIQPVHGHGSSDTPSPFHQIKNDVGEVIHFTDNPEISLASAAVNDYVPKHLGDTTIKVHWLVVEGVQKTTQNPQGNKVEPSGALLKYFDKITQAVLGFDSEMMKTALSDLRTNCNISPILPHLVSFIANGVKTVSHDVRQLSKLLYTTQSLVYNSSLFLEAQPLLSQLIQAVQYCLLEPLTIQGNQTFDQWSLRDYAARLLSHIVSLWGNSVNHLQRFTEKTLRETLYDHTKPSCAHYGAIMGLLYLGSESIERVLLPHIKVFWPHLMSAIDKSGPETVRDQLAAFKVYGAVLLAVEHVLRKYIKQFKDTHLSQQPKQTAEEPNLQTLSSHLKSHSLTNSSGVMSMFEKSPVNFYNEMIEYFGDSLALRLPEILELKKCVFKGSPKEVKTTLEDKESHKSGEELLAELVEEVKQEQEGKKIKQEGKSKLLKVKQEPSVRQRQAQHDRRQQLRLAQQGQGQLIDNTAEDDGEIDIEGDNDKWDNSYLSAKSEEDLTGNMSVAVKSSIGEPGQGIKMTFTKKPKMTQFSGDSPFSDYSGEVREKETTRQGRKRKQSPESLDFDISQFE